MYALCSIWFHRNALSSGLFLSKYETIARIYVNKLCDTEDNMLTDMTPAAGQFYGAQIPAMTMNIKNSVVSIRF